MLRPCLAALAIAVTTAACGAKQPPAAPAAPAPEATAPAPEAAVPAAEVPTPAAAAFNQTLELQGIQFTVASANDATPNKVTVTPVGLEADNSAWTQDVDGIVTGAEVGDLNADGSPEVYVYVRSTAPDAKGSVLGYAANKRKSLSEVSMDALADDPANSAGYAGHDEFAVLEGVLGRRFPLVDAAGAATGKMRQLQYKLKAGEAGWLLQVDKTTEFPAP